MYLNLVGQLVESTRYSFGNILIYFNYVLVEDVEKSDFFLLRSLK